MPKTKNNETIVFTNTIGQSIWITKEQESDQIKKGTEHEKEHTDDEATAKQIAADHLKEDPQYYTHLDEMEKKVKGENFKEGRKYVKSPADAPKGVSVKRGTHGGYYYEPSGKSGIKGDVDSGISIGKDVDAGINKKFKPDDNVFVKGVGIARVMQVLPNEVRVMFADGQQGVFNIKKVKFSDTGGVKKPQQLDQSKDKAVYDDFMSGMSIGNVARKHGITEDKFYDILSRHTPAKKSAQKPQQVTDAMKAITKELGPEDAEQIFKGTDEQIIKVAKNLQKGQQPQQKAEPKPLPEAPFYEPEGKKWDKRKPTIGGYDPELDEEPEKIDYSGHPKEKAIDEITKFLNKNPSNVDYKMLRKKLMDNYGFSQDEAEDALEEVAGENGLDLGERPQYNY